MSTRKDDSRFDSSRTIRAPRGPELSCRSWLTEAPFRMLQNNLDPDVAENPAPGAKQRYLAGRFISTWLRDADGTWHVAFDGGGGNVPMPASAEDIERLEAGRKACTPA